MFGASPFGWPYFGQAYAGTTSSGSVKTLVSTSNGSATVSVVLVRTRARAATASGSAIVTAALGKATGTRLLSATAHGAATATAFLNPVWYIIFNRDLKVIEHIHDSRGKAELHRLDLASGGMSADNLSVQTLEK